MKKTSTILFLSLILTFTACSESKQEQEAPTEPIKVQETLTKSQVDIPTKIQKSYSIDEIYMSMCIECHSDNGSGNTEKLTPSMIAQTKDEIKDSLLHIENDEGHIVMQHNRGEILKMGMNYSAEDMANYMHSKFSK